VSYYVVKPPGPSRLAGKLVLSGVGALAVLALLAGWAAARPIAVTVDGRVHRVRPGTTVAQLSDAWQAPSGRLLGVRGEVVLREGGSPPVVMHNGKPARLSQRLFAGDVIESEPGADALESVIVTDVPLPFETKYEGSGPLTEMRTLGAPGVRRVTLGALSGAELTSTVVRESSPMVIVRSRPSGKVVALTFDDGPWPGQTEQILRVLEREDVHATFFMLGGLAKKNPALVRQVAEKGHAIGNHTYSHKSLARLSTAGMREEIARGRGALEDIIGGEVPWLRPPYGAMDADAWREVRRMDIPTVLWDVDSRDWTRPGTKKIVSTVTRQVRPGSVVLFHDGGGDRRQTVSAIGPIIRKLKKQGYSFVTLQELQEIEAEAAEKKRADSEPSDRRTEAPAPSAEPPG
jgi:peptidoglycan/xylan/chitin deacetylase (PgdA/CDA1 family)